MTRSDLEDALFYGLGLSRPEAQRGVTIVLGSIAQALREGREVRLNNFGVFDVQMRAARPARNPRTNTPVIIPARRVVTFRAADSLLHPEKAKVTRKALANKDVLSSLPLVPKATCPGCEQLLPLTSFKKGLRLCRTCEPASVK